MVRNFITAAAALALVSSPAIAADLRSPAAALSIASEQIDESSNSVMERTGILIPLIVGIAIGLGFYALVLDKEEPVSA